MARDLRAYESPSNAFLDRADRQLCAHFPYALGVAVHERCRSDLLYCEVHDADFCPSCDEWGEAPCGDPDCDFCPTRADRPSECSHGGGRHWNMND